MDEARAVLSRLRRIERLDRAGGPARALLAEIRALLGDAEAWLRAEAGADARARAAVDGLRTSVARRRTRAGPGAGLW